MKIKVLFFLLVMGFMLIACEKEYICECTMIMDYGDGDVDTSNVSGPFTAKNDKKAKAACEVEQVQKFFGMTQTTVCKVK